MLDEESRIALDRLQEMTGGMSLSFTRTWLMRLNDRWQGCALDAIGETQYLKIKGEKAKKGWGETANFFFGKYKAQTFKTRATAE